MMDWLISLAAIGACALLHAWVETRTPPSAAPRRNYDVLAPSEPRLGATRTEQDRRTADGIWGPLTPAQRDGLLTARVFGPAADPILVIRPEVRDGRQ